MVLATEWTVLGVLRYWWSRLHDWWRVHAPATPAVQEPEAEHEPLDMDVDEANLHAGDELNELDELRRLLAESDERAQQSDALIVRLHEQIAYYMDRRDHLHGQTLDLRRQIDEHAQVCPLEHEVFTTVATGRCWHRDRDCRHLRGVRFRALRHCADFQADDLFFDSPSLGNVSGVNFLSVLLSHDIEANRAARLGS